VRYFLPQACADNEEPKKSQNSASPKGGFRAVNVRDDVQVYPECQVESFASTSVTFYWAEAGLRRGRNRKDGSLLAP
jgi:hypothetical protein